MIIRVTKFTFLGFIMGYLAAVVLSRWTWLEMRFNTSLIILALTILAGSWGFFKKPHWHKGWLFAAEILLVAVFLVTYQDLSALTVLPAIKFREAFFLDFLSLPQANMVLLLLWIAGNILWGISDGRSFKGGNLIGQLKKKNDY